MYAHLIKTIVTIFIRFISLLLLLFCEKLLVSFSPDNPYKNKYLVVIRSHQKKIEEQLDEGTFKSIKDYTTNAVDFQ